MKLISILHLAAAACVAASPVSPILSEPHGSSARITRDPLTESAEPAAIIEPRVRFPHYTCQYNWQHKFAMFAGPHGGETNFAIHGFDFVPSQLGNWGEALQDNLVFCGKVKKWAFKMRTPREFTAYGSYQRDNTPHWCISRAIDTTAGTLGIGHCDLQTLDIPKAPPKTPPKARPH